MSSGCGCKEVYRFPHITYPVSDLFCSSIPTLCSLKKFSNDSELHKKGGQNTLL